MKPNHTEIEVKFFLPDIEEIRKAIIQTGATRKGKVFEYNIRFDDSEKSLIRKKILLRLRKDTQTRLTYKSPHKSPDGQFKMMKELEVTVSDFDTMVTILKSLGFEPVQVYEKWRETFESEHVEFCIDSLPFGTFLEIEGEKDSIRNMVNQLNLAWEKRILANYLEIFEQLKHQVGLHFSDVTFKNFEGLQAEQLEMIKTILNHVK